MNKIIQCFSDDCNWCLIEDFPMISLKINFHRLYILYIVFSQIKSQFVELTHCYSTQWLESRNKQWDIYSLINGKIELHDFKHKNVPWRFSDLIPLTGAGKKLPRQFYRVGDFSGVNHHPQSSNFSPQPQQISFNDHVTRHRAGPAGLRVKQPPLGELY